MSIRRIPAAATAALSAAAVCTGLASAASSSFLAPLTHVTSIGSTVPANGDINPYGIAWVKSSAGKLKAGEMLISNFNAKSNNQGTGTTLVELSTTGKLTQFAQITPQALSKVGGCPGGVGLTTALTILPGGWVVVGSLPTSNGKAATAQTGCLIVLSSNGTPVKALSGTRIAGPWDMTAVSHGSTSTLFVSNILGSPARGTKVLNDASIVRITLTTGATPKVTAETVIADKIPWRGDPTALVIGPTGLALGSDGSLYVANTLDNQIDEIPSAMTRTKAISGRGVVVSSGGHLKQPLGLTLAPNGDILTTNGGDGNVVETTDAGKQVAVVTADTKTGAGSLFGLVVADGWIYYVDDGDNTVKELS
jgi:hypothetical protein